MSRILTYLLLRRALKLLDKPRRDETVQAADLTLAKLRLSRAEAFMKATLATTDHLDTKALHLIVGDIAAFTILVTFQKNWYWAIPEGFLACAALFFCLVFYPRTWELGPEPAEFQPGHTLDSAALHQALTEQLMLDANDNDDRLRWKSRFFVIGFSLLFFGLALTFLIAVIDR